MSTRKSVEIDDDLLSRLREEVRETGKPFKTVVNEALRRGLDLPTQPREPYRVPARPLGLRPGIDLDDIHGLIERLDGPSYR